MLDRALTSDPQSTADQSRQRRAFVIVGTLAVAHVFLTWGYTGLFWGDHGEWLEEVSRFARGDVLYRDFSWASPPLAIWILGGVARFTGTSLAAINATTAVLFLMIVALFLFMLKRLTPQLILPIALPAFLCASAYASRSGAPLPMGTTSPAGPVGFLCLLGAAAMMLSTVDQLSRRTALLAGVLAGLAILSKQDFWLSAGYALLVGTLLLARRNASIELLLAPAAGCAVTVAVGLALVVSHAGLVPFLRMMIGPDDLVNLSTHLVPSLERLTAEVAAAAALCLTAVVSLWLCLAISERRAGQWALALALVFLVAMAVHMGMSVAIGRAVMASGPEPLPTVSEEMMALSLHNGRSLPAGALSFFDERLRVHFFPAVLPPLLLAVLVLRWRLWFDRKIANQLVLLLGLCVVARIHRGFDGADWYNVMLELPCYALFLQLICGPATQKAARAVRAALSVVILIGFYSRITMGRGPFTLSGSLPVTMTNAGPVHWSPFSAHAYHLADSLVKALDPTGRRSVYAFGASGGWNYFLGRRNPTPATGGIRSGPWTVDRIEGLLQNASPPVILIDNRSAMRSVPGPMTSPFHWEPEPRPNRFLQTDRRPFERLARSCTPMSNDSIAGTIAVWDCAKRPGTTR